MTRYSQAEKMEIIRLVETSELSVKQTLQELAVPRSTFYKWYARYQREGYAGLAPRTRQQKQFWNQIPDSVRAQVVELALEKTELSARELACYITDTEGYFISESSVYRILKANDLVGSPIFEIVSAQTAFEHPTQQVNELWQTDFTQFKVQDWGYSYLCTILDDYSRYIIAWRLASTMTSTDVEETLQMAIDKTSLSHIKVIHRPRLLTDNGSAFVSAQFANYLDRYQLTHIRGAPYHPQTQGKIERYHRSMKSIVKLDNYYTPTALRDAIASFVDYYNNERYHEALDNIIPVDVFNGRQQVILEQRAQLKQQTLRQRRQTYWRECILLR